MESRSLRNYVSADKSDAALVPDFYNHCKWIQNIKSVPRSSLLSLALLFRICKDMESDENTSNRLFIAVCKHLQNLKYLDPNTALLSDLIIKQPQFTDAITEFMQQHASGHDVLTLGCVQSSHTELSRVAQYINHGNLNMHDQMLNPAHSLVPSARKCLDKKLSLSSIYTYQTNRYSETFDELDVIAEGGFGTVCKARHKVDKAVYAVKKIFFKYKNDVQFEKIIREAKQLAALKHPHIVNYNNAWLDTADDVGGGTESDSSSSSSPENTPDIDDDSQNTKYFFQSYAEYTHLSFSPPTHDASPLEIDEAFEPISIDVECQTSEPMQHRRHSSGATCSLADFQNEGSSPPEISVFDDDNEKSVDILSHDMKKLTIRATLYIQMEYCDHDLRSWLRLRSNKTGNSIMQQLKPMDIFNQVLSGVKYIHSKSVIHRDLTPNNIFITKEKGIVKIGDFGLACLVHQTQESKMTCSNGSLSSVLGTPPYGAPEQRENHQYDFKVDIYSLGIVLLELLCPCETSMEFSLLVEDVLKENYPPQLIQKLPDHVRLIKQMTKTDPTNRPTATEILDSPLFKQKCVKKRAEDLKDRLLKLSNLTLSLEELVGLLKKAQSDVVRKCHSENEELRHQNEMQSKKIEELERQIARLQLSRVENITNE